MSFKVTMSKKLSLCAGLAIAMSLWGATGANATVYTFSQADLLGFTVFDSSFYTPDAVSPGINATYGDQPTDVPMTGVAGANGFISSTARYFLERHSLKRILALATCWRSWHPMTITSLGVLTFGTLLTALRRG